MDNIIKGLLFQADDRPQFWQLRDVQFQVDERFELIPDLEKILWEVDSFEDFKGNPGSQGSLVVTNMRIIWYETEDPEENISIGWDTISKADKRVTFLKNSKMKQHLYIRATSIKAARFDFQFISESPSAPKLVENILHYHQQGIIESDCAVRVNIIERLLSSPLAKACPSISRGKIKSIGRRFLKQKMRPSLKVLSGLPTQEQFTTAVTAVMHEAYPGQQFERQKRIQSAMVGSQASQEIQDSYKQLQLIPLHLNHSSCS